MHVVYQRLYKLDVAPVAGPHQRHPTLIVLTVHICPVVHQLVTKKRGNEQPNKQTNKQIKQASKQANE